MHRTIRHHARAVPILLLNLAVLQLAGCPGGTTQQFLADEEPGPQDAYPIAECGQVAPVQVAESTGIEIPPDGLTDAGQEIHTKLTHSPLYSTADHTSHIRINAAHPDGQLQSIAVDVTQGLMTDCSNDGAEPERITPCREDASICTYECLFDGKSSEESCDVFIAISGPTLVSYQATVEAADGSLVSSDAITYSGGEPLSGVAAPVRWHTEATSGTLADQRIDLALVPDADLLTDIEVFASNASDNLHYIFQDSQKSFSERFYQNRDLFDLWVAPFPGADAEEMPDCYRNFTGDQEDIDAAMDGILILHNEEFRDCASVSKGGSGTVYVGDRAEKPSWVLVHESAHMLFGLSDEYGDSPPEPKSDPWNVFNVDQDCWDAVDDLNAEYGLGLVAYDACKTIGTTADYYRVFSGTNETMVDRKYNSDFRDTSHSAVEKHFNLCRAGNCY